MSRLDDLPPDQRATLSLLLRSRKSYADVATLLEIPEQAVRDRAHAALAVLAPSQARSLDA
ncbi:MAG TPA: sigma factor-like helix-turn-helix DNA-binding protein, partial [Solirubrobacteraceae bacterium]|nr:sigma factor-like helix-turn-helix DNA-binding protein [Solirubrobacteraceae bacterium]